MTAKQGRGQCSLLKDFLKARNKSFAFLHLLLRPSHLGLFAQCQPWFISLLTPQTMKKSRSLCKLPPPPSSLSGMCVSPTRLCCHWRKWIKGKGWSLKDPQKFMAQFKTTCSLSKQKKWNGQLQSRDEEEPCCPGLHPSRPFWQPCSEALTGS